MQLFCLCYAAGFLRFWSTSQVSGQFCWCQCCVEEVGWNSSIHWKIWMKSWVHLQKIFKLRQTSYREFFKQPRSLHLKTFITSITRLYSVTKFKPADPKIKTNKWQELRMLYRHSNYIGCYSLDLRLGKMTEQFRLEGTYWDHLVQPRSSSRVSWSMLLRATSSWVLNISTNGDSKPLQPTCSSVWPP